MLSKKKADQLEFSCATPTVEILSTTENLSRVLETHAWEVDKSEAYGNDGILLRIHCKNCGLKTISIISDIPESAKKARESRTSIS